MQTITPHLWFDTQAKQAADFYVDVFKHDSRITNVTPIEGAPGGTAELIAFNIRGQDMLAISAGPVFSLNPSISFILNFDPSTDPHAQEDLNACWERLAEGGKALMPLGEYPFSRRYGWIEDRYGVSWQLMLTNPTGEPRPFLTPSLLFVGDQCGRAEEAMREYVSIFQNSKIGTLARYGADRLPDAEGTIMYEDFQLNGVWMAAMDSAHKHAFAFNEALSFVVTCNTQEEIDYFWSRLSKQPAAEQCGWCKDAYGVSWQIVPASLARLMNGTPEERLRVTQAFLGMKKFDIAALEKAFNGT